MSDSTILPFARLQRRHEACNGWQRDVAGVAVLETARIESTRRFCVQHEFCERNEGHYLPRDSCYEVPDSPHAPRNTSKCTMKETIEKAQVQLDEQWELQRRREISWMLPP